MAEEKEPKLVMFTNNGTRLDPDKDVDLQDLALSKFDSPKRGKEEAIKKINALTGLGLTERDFRQEYYQTDIQTGKKNEPVEWFCAHEGKYHNVRGTWIARMSMDDPPPVLDGRRPNGPDRPHIGYRVDFDNGSGHPRRIQSGHVYVPWVPASRMEPKSEANYPKRR